MRFCWLVALTTVLVLESDSQATKSSKGNLAAVALQERLGQAVTQWLSFQYGRSLNTNLDSSKEQTSGDLKSGDGAFGHFIAQPFDSDDLACKNSLLAATALPVIRSVQHLAQLHSC